MLWKWVSMIILGVGLSSWIGTGVKAAACPQPGWFPTTFGLKDHHVFWYDGFYYLISIYLGPEDQFAYGRSSDLCTWQELSPVLPQRTPGTWDEAAIWSPYVYEEDGVYYLFYTGVTNAFAQSIMLATSTNPADPESWQTQDVIFQPTHPGKVWGGFDTYSDCRDPTILKIGRIYYLYYTGLDQTGGIVGVATAPSPLGPWVDRGAVLTLTSGMPESPTLVSHDGSYYLFYNDTIQGESFRSGEGPTGPWTEAFLFRPGWAHEIWQGHDGYSYTSYLTNYSVTISHLTWDSFYDPPRPYIGENVYHLMFPLISR
jgi:hypothetical protein